MRVVWRDFRLFLAFGLGSGCMPYAPGTFGTLAAIPFYILLSQLHPWTYAVVWLFSAFIATYLSDYAEKKIGVADHSGIVVDEFIGFWLTMWWVPCTLTTIAAGFVLFRFFDILKPWPIRVIDRRLAGGLGVVLDDVWAGIYAAIVMQSLLRLGWC